MKELTDQELFDAGKKAVERLEWIAKEARRRAAKAENVDAMCAADALYCAGIAAHKAGLEVQAKFGGIQLKFGGK